MTGNGNETSLLSYSLIYASLILLLGLTYVAQSIDLATMNLAVALAIASAKAALVLFGFMHLRSSGSLARIYALIAAAWTVILVLLSFCDFFFRL